ncbi:hypothetical protein EFW57_03279 [Bacillus velezensis]|nr:hypothetical protein EFW57_03279 [Bacillus velezensis]
MSDDEARGLEKTTGDIRCINSYKNRRYLGDLKFFFNVHSGSYKPANKRTSLFCVF